MRTSIIVVDGFYNDADAVRAQALGIAFDVRGNFPGVRTKPHRHQGIRDGVQLFVPTITGWENEYNGCFQRTSSADRTWVHSDHTNNWAGVLFLTPDAPLTGGTAFYRHATSGWDRNPEADPFYTSFDGSTMGAWEQTDYVANKFNRLVLYDAQLFHQSVGHFGTCEPETQRLFQVFFFTTN